MNTSRIDTVMCKELIKNAVVLIVGLGGAVDLAKDLVRCGFRYFRLVDFDQVDVTNIARQGHVTTAIGESKVLAAAQAMKLLNPKVTVETYSKDITKLTEVEDAAIFEGVSVALGTTDNYFAQATVSDMSVKYDIPCVIGGMYEGAVGSEIFVRNLGMPACYRCINPSRESKLNKVKEAGQYQTASSQGATILDVKFCDSIMGMLAIGLVTSGSDNRFGRLIEQLGNRQLLVTKIDPSWKVSSGRDFVRGELGIADDCEGYFAFNTVALAADKENAPACPVCDQNAPCDFVVDEPLAEQEATEAVTDSFTAEVEF